MRAIIHVTNQMYTYKLFRSFVLIKVLHVEMEISTFHPLGPPPPLPLLCLHLLTLHILTSILFHPSEIFTFSFKF